MCFSILISSYTTAYADQQKKHHSTSLATAPPRRKNIYKRRNSNIWLIQISTDKFAIEQKL